MTNLVYKASPTVARFMMSEKRVRVLAGPVGSGKSAACVMEIARRSKMQRPGRDGIRRSRWVVVRNTREQLKDTTLKTWMDWLPPGVAGTWKETDRTFFLRMGDTEAEVLFRPLDTAEDVQRLLSLELTGGWLNECREIPEEIVRGVISRLGRYPASKDGGPSWYGLIADTNMPEMDSYWHRVMAMETPENWDIFIQPGGLDPAAENRDHLPPTYYEDMMVGATQDWINVYVHAKYGRALSGTPVYLNSFNPEFHIAPEPLVPVRAPGYPIVIGMDFGRTPAAVFKQMDPRGRVLTLEEITSKNMSLEGFLATKVKPVLAVRYPEARVIVSGDPSGWYKSQLRDESVGDIFKAAGLQAIPAPTNDVERRIQATERWLSQQVDGKALYLVSPRCEILIKGFKSGYRYKAKKNGELESSPDKNDYSHPHDANQYADLVIGTVQGMAVSTRKPVQNVSALGWT